MAPRGEQLSDDPFLLVLNGSGHAGTFLLPGEPFGTEYQVVVDTVGGFAGEFGHTRTHGTALPMAPFSAKLLARSPPAEVWRRRVAAPGASLASPGCVRWRHMAAACRTVVATAHLLRAGHVASGVRSPGVRPAGTTNQQARGRLQGVASPG